MTNPNDAVGTNGAYEGRTSVNAFNDVMGGLTRGVLSGWVCSPSSGMTIQLGGDGTSRDVAIAEDNAGNKTSINNISQAPVEVTLSAAPATGSRIDAIVAYVDNPPQGDAAQVDNFAACGLIAVSGTAANNPVVPTDGIIRTAITGDGANGATAYYVILATVRVGTNVSTIGSGVITQGTPAEVTASLADGSVTADKIDWTTINPRWRVASVVSGTNEFVIPAGYKHYRLVMRFGSTAPTTAARPTIGTSSKSGQSFMAGIYADGSTVGTITNAVAEENSPIVAYLSGVANTLAMAPFVEINLERLGTNGFVGNYRSTGSGLDFTMVGKIEFTAGTTGDFYLFARRNNSTISGVSGYVEVLEN